MKSKIEVAAVAQTVASVLKFSLCVFSQFRDYKRGDLIHDAEEIVAILSCHEKDMVNKVTLRD